MMITHSRGDFFLFVMDDWDVIGKWIYLTANYLQIQGKLQKGAEMVGDTGVEPVTSCVSCMRSNQLS